MRQFKILTIFLSCLTFSNANSQNRSKTPGGWINVLSYDYSTVGSKESICGFGYIFPYSWLGFGLDGIGLYQTREKYEFIDWGLRTYNNVPSPILTYGNYGLLSLFSPTIFFIPLARQKEFVDGLDEFRLYLTYAPWAMVRLMKTEYEIKEVHNMFSKSTILDLGASLTFNYYVSFCVKAGYISLYNPDTYVNKYEFPSHRIKGPYLSAGLSLTVSMFEGREFPDKFVFAPFIADMFSYQAKLQRDWERTRSIGSMEAYDRFIKKYPYEEFSKQAKINQLKIREQNDWNYALSTNQPNVYWDFIEKWPNSQYRNDAMSKGNLFERYDWSFAQRENNAKIYREFIYNYPNGEFVSQAISKQFQIYSFRDNEFLIPKEEIIKQLIIEAVRKDNFYLSFFNMFNGVKISNLEVRSFDAECKCYHVYATLVFSDNFNVIQGGRHDHFDVFQDQLGKLQIELVGTREKYK